MKPHSVDWQVLRVIRRDGPIAQHRLADWAGLSRSTVNGAVRRLAAAGCVEAVGREGRGRGRPGVLLGLRRGLGYFVGVDLAGRQSAVAVVAADGAWVGGAEADVGRRREPARVVDQIELLVRGVLSRLGAGIEQLLGLWVGVHGVVNSSGRVLISAALGWHDVPLADRLQERFACELLVRGGASPHNACAEALIGAGRSAESMLYFQAGDGISGRLVSRGQLLSGTTQRAGELGHVVVERGGRRCGCGNRGCLETVASGPALVRALAQLPPPALPGHLRVRLRAVRGRRQDVRQLLKDVFADLPADQRHPASLLLAQTGDRLAWGAALAIAAYDPELVVLGGYLFQDHPSLVQSFDQPLRRYVMDWRRRNLTVTVAELPVEERALNGAAEICQRYWATPPNMRDGQRGKLIVRAPHATGRKE